MRHYPSKLLLFGEHILLLGARALAVPVPAFSGQWAWRPVQRSTDKWSARLLEFAGSAALKAVPGLDYAAFETDLKQGLHFRSNIPAGYGLGSSGALCAAIYDRYTQAKATDPAELKGIFAGMESFFHGQSSGIDPLTSYLNRALWIIHRTDIDFFEPPVWSGAEPVVFLLDSRLPRRTAPLVEWFLEQSRKTGFAQLLETALFPAHEAMLQAWQTGDAARFWPALKRVSQFQLNYMPPMIPETVRAVWEASLDGQGLYFKICGAGGGGFVLGFAADKHTVIEKFSTFDPVFPFEYNDVAEQ